MKLTLIVPGLNACSAAAVSASAALKRLAVFARAPSTLDAGLDAATLEALGLPATTAVAPLRALGAGLDVGDDYVLAADPVMQTAGMDDVVLDAKIDDLAPAETDALIGTLNAHFAQDGLEFVAPRADAFFARTASTPALDTTPLSQALGRPIFELLPRGADGKTWQRWQNEIQMLLHDHPVNAARSARGASPVTGLWFWGGGRLRDAPGGDAVVATSAAGAAGDLVRGYARHRQLGRTADGSASSLSEILAHARGSRAVAAVAVDTDAALAAFGNEWLAPALVALGRGQFDAVDVVADGHGVSTRWHAPRPSSFVRLTARWRGSRFVLPSFDGA